MRHLDNSASLSKNQCNRFFRMMKSDQSKGFCIVDYYKINFEFLCKWFDLTLRSWATNRKQH